VGGADDGVVQQYVANRLGDGAAGNTVLNELRLIRTISRDSVAEGLAERHWADRVKPPAVRVYDEDDPNMLGAAQLYVVLRAVPPRWLPLASFMAFTGLRWGEVSALRWKDLDAKVGVIRIRRGNWKGQLATPKTSRSRRIVPIPDNMKADGRTGWIFPNAGGDLHKGTPLRRVMQIACAAAGVQYTTPHGLRRTYNNLLRQVTNAQIVKAMIGHTTDSMTEHYSLVGAEEKKAAAKKVLELVAASVDEVTQRGGATSGTTEGHDDVQVSEVPPGFEPGMEVLQD
jgi:integrase